MEVEVLHQVDIRHYQKLFYELLPLVILKAGNVSPAQAEFILKEKFGIEAYISSKEHLFTALVGDETFMWLNLKWK